MLTLDTLNLVRKLRNDGDTLMGMVHFMRCLAESGDFIDDPTPYIAFFEPYDLDFDVKGRLLLVLEARKVRIQSFWGKIWNMVLV